MGDSLKPEDEVINCRLHIAGMVGPNCAGRVERALMAVPGVQNAIADAARGDAIVRAAGNASVEQIGRALDEAGYRLHSVDGDLDPTPEPTPEPTPAPEPEPAPAPPPPEPVPTPIVVPEREAPYAPVAEPSPWSRPFRQTLRLIAYLFFLSLVWIAAYRFLPVPATIHMVGETVFGGHTLRYQWVPLERISPNLDAAARTLGETAASALIRVHVPLLLPALGTAALLVFVDVMKELPATLLLRPFNFDTLATHVYALASLEKVEAASVGALAIVLVGLVPVLLLHRAVARGRAGD